MGTAAFVMESFGLALVARGAGRARSQELEAGGSNGV